MSRRDYVHIEARHDTPGGATGDTSGDTSGGGIVIHWDSETCVHSGVCLRTLPRVFNVRQRPWVDPDGADTDAIERAVQACPSGALTSTQFAPGETPPVRSFDEAEHAAGDPEAPGAAPTSIKVLAKGPYLLKGQVEIIDADGTVARRVEKVALCRCGNSRNRPFCDGSHHKTGWDDEGAVPAES